MRTGIILALLFMLAGCKKDTGSQPYRQLQLPVSFTIRDVHVFTPNEFIVSGGDNGIGVVLKTTDQGNTWQLSSTAFTNQVNCLYFVNADTGYCADSDILIYKTTDGGTSWSPYYAASWPLTVNRNLRDIWFTSGSTGFICGGKNFGNGVLYTTQNSGEQWYFREYSHEYRGICFRNQFNGIMCGYGSVLLTNDGGATFSSLDRKRDFYTGISIDRNGNFWMCEFNGRVYMSNDGGNTWQEKRKAQGWNAGQSQINCISVSSHGFIACAGPEGFLTWSLDGGNSWNNRHSVDKNDIHEIQWLDFNKLIAVGSGGVFMIEI